MRDHYPLAYHITFGTYGTRLHGDERGTVDRRMNQRGDPIIGAEPDWEWMEYNKLRFPPRELDVPQRQLAEGLIPEICTRAVAIARPRGGEGSCAHAFDSAGGGGDRS